LYSVWTVSDCPSAAARAPRLIEAQPERHESMTNYVNIQLCTVGAAERIRRSPLSTLITFGHAKPVDARLLSFRRPPRRCPRPGIGAHVSRVAHRQHDFSRAGSSCHASRGDVAGADRAHRLDTPIGLVQSRIDGLRNAAITVPAPTRRRMDRRLLVDDPARRVSARLRYSRR